MKQPTTTAGRLLRAGAVCAGLAGTLLALSAGEAARLVPLPPPDPPRPARGPQVPADADVLGRGIQRTMTLLATSTPQRRNRVRILFYGQSITEQDWSKQVTAKLKERFPHADLEVENRAIGGFASQLLVRPSVHDVAPFYPDLMIFHVYGGNKEYEEIIATTRSRTTAEVLMQTDHVTKWPVVPADPNGDKGLWWDHMMNDVFLPQIAAKYDCGLLDVRTGWLKHLLKEKLEPAALLSDGVHLNDKGNALMAELVGRYLVYRPELPSTKWKGLVRTYELGKDLRMRNGKLRLPFTGNRIDLLPAVPKPGTVASADVLIDGKKPSEFPELYAIARPSATQLGFWPGIKRVSHQKPLALETWRARITEVNDAADQFKFSVTGSVTGADGAGTSGQRFVSNSGRVVIEPEDWHLKSAREFGKKNVPEGFEVTWTVIPQFVDVYQAPKEVDATRDNAVTLAQGLPNGPHTLELSTPDGKPLAIRAIRVYEPPFKLAPVPGK